MANVFVVKIGGATFGSHDTTVEDIVALQNEGRSVIVVHGGGKLITEWLSRQKIPSRFVQGERVTDQAALQVVVSVLAGLVNKEIVTAINGRGGRAIGISGVDGFLIQASVRNPELGYVGRIDSINARPLVVLLEAGYVPVVAPIGIGQSDRTDSTPQILNINADIVAGEIAAAVKADKLIFLTDVAGILDASGKRYARLLPDEAEALIATGVATGGMVPKITSCLKALSGTPTTCIIDGTQPHALRREIEAGNTGTTIERGKKQ